MRILITNVSLRGRTGTETAVRDLAVNLARRGHSTMVFARRLGKAARELRSAGIPIVGSIDRIGTAPDVIHGHHNIPSVAALVHFPECPAIWVSRDTRYWFDRPPLLDRIHRYMAIDDLRRDYLVNDFGIDPRRVGVLYNAVDLGRIPPRPRDLPGRPTRALSFTKTANEVDLMRRACARAGIVFSAIGRGVGIRTAEPEKVLVEADIVFATGRSALEALCAGAAVIVGDGRGLAGMVTRSNCDHLRNFNFGRGAFDKPLTDRTIAVELAKYDRDEAIAVAQWTRSEADLDKLLVRLETLYRDAITARSDPRWSTKDLQALLRFVEDWPATRWSSRLRWRDEHRRISAFARSPTATP